MRTYWSIHWYKWIRESQNEKFPIGENKRLTIILPAYKEQSVVQETLDYFSFLCSNTPDVNVLVVLSKSEGKAGINQPSTKKLVKDWLKSHAGQHTISYLEYSGDGGKSSKINFAIKSLSNSKGTHWVGIYDFDSKPDQRTISAVLSSKYDDYDHIQQIPASLADVNSDGFKEKISSVMTRNEEIFHIQRCLAIEVDFFQKSQSNICAPMRTFMGSGMFFRLSSLQPYLPFPEPIDDITMGYRFQFARLNSGLLPYFNVSTLTPSTKQLFRQNLRIFYGVFSGLITEWRLALRKGYFRINQNIAFLKALQNYLIVLADPLFLILFLFLSIKITLGHAGTIFLVIGILALSLGYICSYIITDLLSMRLYQTSYESLGMKNKIKYRPSLMLIAPFRPLFRTALVFYFIFALVTRRLAFLRTKTVR